MTSLISEAEIAAAVSDLGRRISEDFQGRQLTVLGVLTGSIVFVADLMRKIEIPHQLGLLQASSYRGGMTVPGELALNLDFLPNLQGRDVLLIDDIFDTGRTVAGIVERLRLQEPQSVKVAVLLWKTARRQVNAVPDYHCFEIPDQFVVGYGLDHNGHHRHLPYIGIVQGT